MFHFMGFPFKVSYFLAALWFLDFLTKSNRDKFVDREFKLFFLGILVIMICGVLGEIFFSFTG